MAVDHGHDVLVRARARPLLVHRHVLPWLILGTVAESLGWNSYGEPSSQTATYGSDSFGTTWDYDALGRVIAAKETVGSSTVVWTYGYDLRGRLIEVKKDGSLVATYGWDANGNRTTMGTSTATFDARDRILSQGGFTFKHGLAGELLERTETGSSKVTSYTWDSLGNLESVTLPTGSKVTYVLDGQHRRVERRVDGTVKKRYVYTGGRLVAEVDGSGAILARYVWATHANVPDYVQRPEGSYRIVSDPRGSVRLVINAATGTVAQRIEYDAFGDVLIDTSPGFQPFAFGGGLWDPDTRLVKLGAREYDPGLGRFLTADPSWIGGGLNLYGYSSGDPINYIDVDGHHPVLVAALVILGGIGVAISTPSDHPSAPANILGASMSMAPFASPALVAAAMNGAVPLLGAQTIADVSGAACGGSKVSRGGLNDLMGSIELSTNANGGQVVTTTGSVRQADFMSYVNSVNSGLMRGNPVNILSGAHGSPAGQIIPSAEILAEDVGAFTGIDGVTVHNIATMSHQEISSLLSSSGTTIGAFCNSGVCLAPYR